MSWGHVAIAAATVISAYMNKQSADAARRDANKARKDASGWQDEAAMVANERLEFEKQQYKRWERLYGSIEENLANFYGSLTPEKLIASGLTKQKTAFNKARENLQRSIAQRGYDSPVSTALETSLDIQEAEANAGLRFSAPFQLATAQRNFTQGAPNNPAAIRMGQAYTGIQQNAQFGAGNAWQNYRYQDIIARNANTQLANTIAGGAYAYAYNQEMNTQDTQNTPQQPQTTQLYYENVYRGRHPGSY